VIASVSSRTDVPEQLQGRFAGQIDYWLSKPTPEGRTEFTLSSGVIDTDAEAFFGRGFCHWLAGAIHCMTGWDLVTYDFQRPDGSWAPAHTAVRTPYGTVLDIFGEHHNEDVEQRYSPNGPVRSRQVPPERFCSQVLGTSTDLDDRWWWSQTGGFDDHEKQVVVAHFARLLLRKHGYGEHLRYPETPHPDNVHTAPELVSVHKHSTSKERATEPARASTPASTPASTASSTHSGGTSMSGVDEIAMVIAQATQNSEQIRSALAQIQQWAEDTSGQLGTVLQGSNQPEVQQSLQAFAQITQQASEMHQLTAGAVDGLESYRGRL